MEVIIASQLTDESYGICLNWRLDNSGKKPLVIELKFSNSPILFLITTSNYA